MSREELVRLIAAVGAALDQADRFGLVDVGIHLDAALNSLAMVDADGVPAAPPAGAVAAPDRD